MRLHVVCPSVRPSVAFRYRDQIGWNSSKIISRPNSLRPMRSLTPNMGDLVQKLQILYTTLKISGKVSAGVLKDTRKFSGHPYIGHIARSCLR